MHRIATQIYNHITSHDGFILVPHQGPDGDALGSVSALANFLHEHDKKFSIYCATPAPSIFQYLPYIDELHSDETIFEDPNFSTVITVDSGDLAYAGIDEHIKKLKDPTLINIDHHASNSNHGNYNLVMTDASSTTEIIHSLFKHNDVAISASMATALLTGLITDTGNFSNAGTSRNALRVASELIGRGANLHKIRNAVLKNKSVGALRFWGTVLSRLQIHADSQIAYTFYTAQDLTTCQVDPEEAEGIANLLNYLNEGKLAMVIKEEAPGDVKVSLRTTHDDVDVSTLAVHFGGGGHRKAAGFSLQHSAKSAITHIFEQLP